MPPSSPDDVERIRRALAGDRRAIDEIAGRLACIPRMLARRNRDYGAPLDDDELRDLAQETIIAIWRKLGTYDGRASLETWAYRFCVYELLHRLRQKRSRPRPWADVSREAAPAEPRSSEPALEDYDLLYRTLGRLGATEGEVVRLKHFEDLTFEEIGDRLEQPTNTVKTRYYRGLLKLRRMLASTTWAEEASP